MLTFKSFRQPCQRSLQNSKIASQDCFKDLQKRWKRFMVAGGSCALSTRVSVHCTHFYSVGLGSFRTRVVNYNARCLVSLFSSLNRRVQIYWYCCSNIFPNSIRDIRGIYRIVGRSVCSLQIPVRARCYELS